MTLKTSSFKINKTIFKKNVVRFWPIWGLYLVIMIFMMPVALQNSLRFVDIHADAAVVAADKTMDLLQVLDMNLLPVPVAIFAVISAVAVFSYLYLSRSCNMMHAFPVKRTELFITNYFSGLLFLLVPQVIGFLLTLGVCGMNRVSGIQYLFMWLLMIFGMSFFFYSIAVFCCMLTGHFFPAFAFYIFFNIVYALFANLIICLAGKICYGIGTVSDMGRVLGIPGIWLSPLVYLCQDHILGPEYALVDGVMADVTMEGALPIGLYCIAAVVFVLLAQGLYRRRDLECASEMTAHKFVKPMTRWMVTIVAAMGLAFWFTTSFFNGARYYVFIFAISLVVTSWTCFFLLEMAINKKFKIFKKIRFLEWGICIAAMLVVTGLMEGDAFGVEQRQPLMSETKAVIVQANHEMVVTEPEEIQRIMNAHRTIIQQKEDYEDYYYRQGDEDDIGEYVSFTYILENGDTFKRFYSIPCNVEYMADETSAAAQIRSLQMDTKSYLKSWLLVNYEDIQLTGGFFYDYNAIGESQTIISKEDMEVLFAAMLKDIEENNIGCYFGANIDGKNQGRNYEYYNNYINIQGIVSEEPVELWELIDSLYTNPVQDATAWSAEVAETYRYYEVGASGYEFNAGFELYSSCTHTIHALLDLGIIEDEAELMDDMPSDLIDDIPKEVIYE